MKMLVILLLMFLLPGIKNFEEDEEATLRPLPIQVSSCDPSDFVDGFKCTLSCYVSYDNITDEYQWIDWAIRYSSSAFNDSTLNPTIQILTNTTADRADAWLISYTMDSYNAGYYICMFEFIFNNTVDLIHYVQTVPIRIDNTTQGSILNENCTNSSDCLPLNSVCNTDGICECVSPYDINYNGLDTTPACLKKLSDGEYCHINDECTKTNEAYDCKVVCTCDGYKRPISEENNVTMCIAAVYLTDGCVYNEQCQLTANNTYCNFEDGGYCDCDPDYELYYNNSNPQKYICYYNPVVVPTLVPTSTPTLAPTVPTDGLSAGAISGIVIGSVAFIAIVIGITYYIAKKTN